MDLCSMPRGLGMRLDTTEIPAALVLRGRGFIAAHHAVFNVAKLVEVLLELCVADLSLQHPSVSWNQNASFIA